VSVLRKSSLGDANMSYSREPLQYQENMDFMWLKSQLCHLLSVGVVCVGGGAGSEPRLARQVPYP
jgi:hypothetical protein